MCFSSSFKYLFFHHTLDRLQAVGGRAEQGETGCGYDIDQTDLSQQKIFVIVGNKSLKIVVPNFDEYLC